MKQGARIALLAAVCVAGCGDDAVDAATEGAAADTTDSLAQAAAVASPAVASAEAPDEIYFDLTRHDWYRRGEPLVHEGRAYQPMGDPVVAPLDAMEEVGTYGDVTYYARSEGRPSAYAVFVPVYYRYWQRFVSPAGSDRAVARDTTAAAP